MTLWLIVRKSLRQHLLSTIITAVSIALATGLLMSVWVVKEQSLAAFENVTGGFDAVMGSRGSELSLVLFSVFHMDKAPGTLKWKDYTDLTEQPANKRYVRYAVPIVVGDNYKSFRIVGTLKDYFTLPEKEMERIAERCDRAVKTIDGLLKDLGKNEDYKRVMPILERAKGPLKEIAQLNKETGKNTQQKHSEMAKLLDSLSENLSEPPLPDDEKEGDGMEFRRDMNDKVLKLEKEFAQFTSDIKGTGPVFTLEQGGRLFREDRQEAIIGSFVAQREKLAVKSVFQPVHGLDYSEGATVHDADYVVVGVLEPTNTPADHVIWIPLQGAQNMEGHEAKLSSDISAILIKYRSAQGVNFARGVNQNRRDVTVANITPTVTAFFLKFEWLRTVLSAMGGLVALVGAGGILASLYNTMNERRREIAILRALGARRGTVFGAILLESATISTIGVLIGFVFYAAFMTTAAWFIREQTGVVIDPFKPHVIMTLAPLGILTLGTLAGILPAAKAYGTDVAENLVPQS